MASGTIRIKAKEDNGITEVKVLITHPMESGIRKDLETGALVPAHFIKEIECIHKDKMVISAIWSGAVSKNPYWSFKVKGTAKLFLNREEGQGLVEYALVLVLVSVVVIAILTLLGPQIGEVFSTITATLGG